LETYEINWTQRAQKDLRSVYDFYSEILGEQKAFEIIEITLEKIDILSHAKSVKVGAIDEEFSHLKYQYKKLIVRNLKITYRLSLNKPIVYINRVFDTRQNPTKNQ
jgi:plasmid stabilization system protein ParE